MSSAGEKSLLAMGRKRQNKKGIRKASALPPDKKKKGGEKIMRGEGQKRRSSLFSQGEGGRERSFLSKKKNRQGILDPQKEKERRWK